MLRPSRRSERRRRPALAAVLFALFVAACEPETLKGPVAIYQGPPPPKHGLLGIQFAPDAKGAPVVADAMPGTPAHEAGVTAGDLIVSVRGKAVATSDEVRNRLADTKPGDTVTLAFTRDGKRTEVEVRLLGFEEVMALAVKRDGGKGQGPPPPQ